MKEVHLVQSPSEGSQVFITKVRRHRHKDVRMEAMYMGANRVAVTGK